MPGGITGLNYLNNQYITYYNLFDSSLATYARIGNKMIQLATSASLSGLTLMAGCSYNNICYVYGGFNGTVDNSQFLQFNPKLNRWTTLTSGLTSLEQTCLLGLGNYIYAIGGNQIGNANSQTTVMTYDLTLGSWSNTTAAQLPVAIGQAAACTLNGSIYMQCGVTQVASSATIVLTMYCYDPISNIWANLANYPNSNGISRHSVVALNNLIYILGGIDGGTGNSTTACYSFSPYSKTYTQIANLPAAQDSGGAVAFNNRIIYFGGETNGTANKNIYIYNPDINVWITDTVTLANTGGQGGSPGCLGPMLPQFGG